MTWLTRFEKIVKVRTPGEWKYDWGNWEVEGPWPDRYVICAMSPDDRAPGFHGQEPNPVDSGADGEFIALFGAVADEILAVVKAAEDAPYATLLHDWRPLEEALAKLAAKVEQVHD